MVVLFSIITGRFPVRSMFMAMIQIPLIIFYPHVLMYVPGGDCRTLGCWLGMIGIPESMLPSSHESW